MTGHEQYYTNELNTSRFGDNLSIKSYYVSKNESVWKSQNNEYENDWLMLYK